MTRIMYSIFLCLPVMLQSMLPPIKKRKVKPSTDTVVAQQVVLPFYSTYHKKTFVTETFEKCEAVQLYKPIKGLAHFEQAIDQCDVEAAASILAENNYQPFHTNLADAITYDDLPAIVYWLNNAKIAEKISSPLDQNCSPRFGTHASLYPLHCAARSGNTFCLKLLHAQGCDLNAIDDHGLRPLDLTVHAGMTNTMQFLLDQGAHENCLNGHERTPLFYLVPRFSQERRVPLQWIKDLVCKFITHAQWDPLQDVKNAAFTGPEKEAIPPLSHEEIGHRLIELRLSLKEKFLPKVLFFQICSYIPEYAYNYRLFKLTFEHVRRSPVLLEQIVKHCPFAWFKDLGLSKLLTSNNDDYVRYVKSITAPIVMYRISRLRELITPNLGIPSALVSECIDEIILDPELLRRAILEALGVTQL